ncbi:hypothetical protein EDD99_5163 [Streptomyces sp. 846.5]|nr:hypothetical protein [Streptomyces sp. 846.5]TDU06600.1 hypothetical protein EDD99_5163 [Streptomyces sp. 846.5]
MSGEKKSESPMSNPFAWVFHASLLILGATIAINLTVAFLRPVLPWLVSGIALLAVTWIAVAIVRWRRSKW